MRSPAWLIATLALMAALLGPATHSNTACAQDASTDTARPAKGEAEEAAEEAAPQETDGRIKVSKETTHITKPLRKDGTVDYLAAMNERYSKGVTAENNAAILLWQALGPREAGDAASLIFKELGMPVLPAEGDYLEDVTAFAARQPDWQELPPTDQNLRRQILWNEQSQAQDRPWTREQFPTVAAWLDENEEELKLIVEATKRPKYFSPLVVTGDRSMVIAALLPLEQESRQAARALTARAMLAAGEGRFEDARRDLLASHRLARLVGQNPFLIGRLVAIAIDAITYYADRGLTLSKDITAEEFERYRKDIEALSPLPPMREAIDVGERFLFLDSVTHIATGGAEASDMLDMLATGDGPDGWQKRLFQWTTGALIDWNDILRRGNRFYDRLVKIFDEPSFAERQAAFDEINQEIKEMRAQLDAENWLPAILKNGLGKTSTKAMGNAFMSLLMPAVTQVDVAETRATAHHRLTLTALALASYHREHGEYPESLAALSPRHLKEVPEDPFVAKPLRYDRTDDGYMLYSVGPNQKADGGLMEHRLGMDDLSVQVPRPREAE